MIHIAMLDDKKRNMLQWAGILVAGICIMLCIMTAVYDGYQENVIRNWNGKVRQMTKRYTNPAYLWEMYEEDYTMTATIESGEIVYIP